MTIRSATETDRAALLGLRRDLWPECSPEQHVRELTARSGAKGVILLAEDDLGSAIGFAEVSIRRDHVEGVETLPVAYLEGWYVCPAARRRGVGRALVNAAAKWAAEAGFDVLASDAEMGNRSGCRAHLGSGFREVGRSVHFIRRCP